MNEQNPNLRPCPDCDKLVSKKAPQCPNCGCPLIGKGAETRLTVGRQVSHLGALLMMKVMLDGEHIFSLAAGERGTALVNPGRHRLSVSCGLSKAESVVVVASCEHKQILVDLVESWLLAKIIFSDVHFEGFYDR